MVKRTLYQLLLFGIFAVALACAVLAVKDAAPFIKSEWEIRQLREKVKTQEHDPNGKETRRDNIYWDQLQEINPDIIAWITVPGTKIDYPVLRCSTWNEYLHKDYKGEYSYPGSIFIQPDVSFSDQHIVVYGHNMASRAMFGSLHDYESKAFGREHPDVYIYEQGRTTHARIYSTYDCEDASETYQTEFRTGKEWMAWLTMTVEENYYGMGVVPVKEDRVITLVYDTLNLPKKSVRIP